MPIIPNTPNLSHIIPTANNINEINCISQAPDLSCDFSETSMHENTLIIPPKMENKCNLIKYQEVENSPINKNLLNDIIQEELMDDTLKNNDKTIVEYESLATEKIEYNTDEEDDKDKTLFFIQAKDEMM
jgi:hypothetical protein